MKHTKHVKQYFHWLFVIAPLISTGAALVLGAEERLVELIFILGAVLVNVVIIWLTLSFDKNSEQSLVRSLLTDDLLPNKSGGPLDFQAELVVIEDEKSHGSFVRRLKQVFADEHELDGAQDLVLIGFSCGAAAADALKLPSKLKDAHAVLVVRTKELEDKPWIYEALNSWAYKRSDVPILFTELDAELRKSSIPDKYFSVPNDPRSIPWRLMQRANERGFEWRRVASFNRLMATNALILLVISLCLGYFLISRQDRDRRIALADRDTQATQADQDWQATLRTLFSAMAAHTKADYQAQTPDRSDSDFSVSYWFRYKGQLRQLVSTEPKLKYMPMTDNKESVIGCAFARDNATAQWVATKPNHIAIWDQGKAVEDSACKYVGEHGDPPKALVCSSYNYFTPLDPEITVGICVVTRRGKVIIGSDDKYRTILRDSARDFFTSSAELIKRKKLVPFTAPRSEVGTLP